MSFAVLQQNIRHDAFIAQEIERRLFEHLPQVSSLKTLDILRDCNECDVLTGKLSYPDAHFDIVIANLVVLWQKDYVNFFKEIQRLLKINGILLFSTLGVETLPTFENLGDELLKLSFDQIMMEREMLELDYNDDESAEKDLLLSGLRENLAQKITLPHETILTLDIIYGRAVKTNKQSSGTIEIPLEKITYRNVP